MAARGSIAKENIKNTLIETFGDKFLGEVGGKLFVLSQENGQDIQIAISLTCPKVGIDLGVAPYENDFVDGFNSDIKLSSGNTGIEFTKAEEETIQELIRKLNL